MSGIKKCGRFKAFWLPAADRNVCRCGRKKRRLPIRSAFIISIKKKRKSRQWKKRRRATPFSKQAEWGYFPAEGKSGRAVFALTDPVVYDQQLECQDDQLVLDIIVWNIKSCRHPQKMLVRAAIVRTMTQLEGISYVSVTVGGKH